MKEGDSTYLLALNHIEGSIIRYSLHSGQQISKLSIHKDGPGAVFRPASFYAFTLDSILILPKFDIARSRIYSRDSIRPLPNYKLLRNQGTTLINHASGTAYGGPIPLNDDFYFLQYASVDLFDVRNMKNNVLEFAVKLGADGYQNLGVHFPPEISCRTWPMNALLLTRIKGHDNKIIYNWPLLDDLLVTDYEHKKFERYEISSVSGAPRIRPLSPSNTNPSNADLFIPMVESLCYPALYYDQYAHVYYRFVRLPLKLSQEEIQTISYQDIDRQPISLIAFDTTFRKIAETKLDNNVFSITGCFSTEDGFFIPKIHPDYDKIDENKREYGIFKLIEKNR